MGVLSYTELYKESMEFNVHAVGYIQSPSYCFAKFYSNCPFLSLFSSHGLD